MDSHQFCKFCTDAKLLDHTSFTKTDAEILFREVKNVYLRKISIVEFSFALDEIGKRNGRGSAEVLAAVKELRGPVFTTKAHPPQDAGAERFYEQKDLYTGVHRYGGPTTVDKGHGGKITDLSQLLDRTPADKRGVKEYDDVHWRRSPQKNYSSGAMYGVKNYAEEPQEMVTHQQTWKPAVDPNSGMLTRRRSLTGERLEFA
jgi:hypothetical protein